MTRARYESDLLAGRPALSARCAKLVGEDADDLLGDVYLHMFSKENWESIFYPVNYAHGVADMLALNMRRKRAHRSRNRTALIAPDQAPDPSPAPRTS